MVDFKKVVDLIRITRCSMQKLIEMDQLVLMACDNEEMLIKRYGEGWIKKGENGDCALYYHPEFLTWAIVIAR